MPAPPPPRFVPASDAALLVRFAGPAAGERVRALARRIGTVPVEGLVDSQAAYASLLLRFDPLATDAARLEARLRELLDPADVETPPPGREIEIPVAYGGVHGRDLDAVAEHASMTPAEVVAAHAAATFQVEFFGFVAGFGYLSGLPARLATPRLDEPRVRVPAGSVAIGGAHAAIYPASTPGGWNLIGRTPLRPARFDAEPWTRFAPGDRLRFVPIGAKEFERLSEWE